MKGKIKKILHWPWFWEKYTEKQWENEMKAPPVVLFLPHENVTIILGTTLPCPNCKTVGFYGARRNPEKEITRKYRACKFCGFWQEAWGEVYNKRGGKPYRCRAVYCEKCRTLDTYLWHLPWAGLGCCPKCSAESKETDWASDNPNHPFRNSRRVQ